MSGGHATAAGILFQMRVATWFGLHMLGNRDLNLGDLQQSIPTRIFIEADSPIDDIRVVTSGGGNIFVNVKTNVSRTELPRSALASVVDQFVRQWLSCASGDGTLGWNKKIDTSRDCMVLATGPSSSDSFVSSTQSLLRRLRANDDETALSQIATTQEERASLSSWIAQITHSWTKHLGEGPTDSEALQLLRSVRILNFTEGETLHKEETELLSSLLASSMQGATAGAWNSLINHFGTMARLRHSADVKRLREVLRTEGLQLKDSPQFAQDIARLQAISSQTLATLQRYAQIEAADCDSPIHIHRECAAEIVQSSVEESFLLVGAPGAGKSGAVYLVAKQLINAGHPVLLLAVDEWMALTPEAFRLELGISSPLEEVLAGWESDKRGVLIIDALDASRGNRSDKVFQKLLIDVQSGLTNWTAIASIRKFDLKYGAHYREAFRGSPVSDSFRDPEFAQVKHFDIPPLTLAELAQVWRSSAILGNAYRNAAQPFKTLVHSPFNLFLLASVVERSSSPVSLFAVTTQTQLLNEYWSYRIDSPSDGKRVERERLLRNVSSHMVETRQLFLTSHQIDTLDAAALNQVLHSGVLLTHGILGKRVSFAHHMLFDYAVARTVLMIDDAQANLDGLALSDDDALMLAPAAMIALRMVWAGSSEKSLYWRLAFALAQSVTAGTFSRMLPARVAAELIASPDEITDLVQQVDASHANRETAAFLIRHIYGTLIAGIVPGRPALGHKDDPWSQITVRLARANAQLLSYPLKVACANWTATPDDLTPKQAADLNETARLLLEMSLHAWQTEDVEDAGATSCGIQGLARTFDAAPKESEAALLKVLHANRVQSFGHNDLFSLSSEIARLIANAPKLVQEIYRASFCTPLPSSAEISHIGESRILALRSNKRQDFQSVQYQLARTFKSFVIAHPEVAVAIFIDILDHYVREEHNVHSTSEAVEFTFGNIQARIKEDHSCVWWEPDGRRHKDVDVMLDQLCEGVVELCDQRDIAAVKRLLEQAARNNCWAALWAAVATAASQRPESLAPLLLPLLVDERVLALTSMTYHLGEVIKQYTKIATDEAVLAIERAVQRISLENDEHDRNVLLTCIPPERLTLPQSLTWLETQKVSQEAFPNEPPFRIQSYKRSGDDHFWYREAGVVVEDEPAASILAAIESTKISDTKSSGEIDGVLQGWPQVLQLHNLILTCEEIPPRVYESAWDRLAEASEKAALVCESQEDLGRFDKLFSLIIEALNERFSPQPVHNLDKENDFARGPSWGRPAPRVEAAAALMAYGRAYSALMPEEFRALVLSLARDPAVAVRHAIVARVNMLCESDPDLSLRIINSVFDTEKNAGILSFFFGALHRMFGNVHAGVAPRLMSFEKAYSDEQRDDDTDLGTNVVTLIVRLWLDFSDESAFERLQEWIVRPAEFSARLTAMLQFLRPAIIFGNPDDASSSDHETRRRTIILIEAVVTRSVEVFTALASITNRDQSQQQDLERVFRVLDVATHQIYFGSGASKKRESTDEPNTLNTKVVKRLLNELMPTFQLLAQVPYPAITHYVLETLEACVEHDPEECLRLILLTLNNGGPGGGYQFESLGERLLVRLVRLYLADYRALISQKSEYRIGLVKALDSFAAAGWADARQLVYELPEMLR